jgi:hypothetical protein
MDWVKLRNNPALAQTNRCVSEQNKTSIEKLNPLAHKAHINNESKNNHKNFTFEDDSIIKDKDEDDYYQVNRSKKETRYHFGSSTIKTHNFGTPSLTSHMNHVSMDLYEDVPVNPVSNSSSQKLRLVHTSPSNIIILLQF